MCLSARVSVSVPVFVCACSSLSLRASLFLSLSVCICPSLSSTVCLCVSVPLCFCVSVSPPSLCLSLVCCHLLSLRVYQCVCLCCSGELGGFHVLLNSVMFMSSKFNLGLFSTQLTIPVAFQWCMEFKLWSYYVRVLFLFLCLWASLQDVDRSTYLLFLADFKRCSLSLFVPAQTRET